MMVVKTTHLTLVWSCAFVYAQVSCSGRDQLLRGRRQDEREREHLGPARQTVYTLDTGLFAFVRSYI